jgi:hypothetical protein
MGAAASRGMSPQGSETIMDELSAELRDAANRFLAAASLIDLDAEGLPCNPDQTREIDIMSELAHRLTDALGPTDGPVERAVWVVAEEWNCLLAVNQHSARRPEMGRRWLAARANAAQLLGCAPSEAGVSDRPSGTLMHGLGL